MEKSDFHGDLRGARFVGASLRGARFAESDLSEVVMRGVDIAGADIDAPWLDGGSTLLVNGVDVAPFVESELNRRFPGRGEKRAPDPEGLRAAWARVEGAWRAALERAAAMPEGSVDISVDGEWSFSQTLRHLVMATDTWLRKAVLQVDDPFHPLGQPDASYAADGHEPSVFNAGIPRYVDVLRVRAERVAMVRDLIAAITPEQLDEARPNPHAPEHPETVRSCLHTILEEEWEHLRFALRDLDSIDAGHASPDASTT